METSFSIIQSHKNSLNAVTTKPIVKLHTCDTQQPHVTPTILKTLGLLYAKCCMILPVGPSFSLSWRCTMKMKNYSRGRSMALLRISLICVKGTAVRRGARKDGRKLLFVSWATDDPRSMPGHWVLLLRWGPIKKVWLRCAKNILLIYLSSSLFFKESNWW